MKPRILVLAQVYLPGYLAGGPVRSIANIVEWLGDDFDWSIVTTDRDLHGREPYSDVPIDQWTRVGNANVFYASPSMCSPINLLRMIRREKYDLLYLNSFFSPIFSFLPIVGKKVGFLPPKPILIAPRGEFSQGAYKIKALKKRVFVLCSKIFGLHQVSWHASTELELKDILRVMDVRQKSIFAARVFSARDLARQISAEGPRHEYKKSKRNLRICFLSRVSPMKNMDYALRVLAQVSVKIEFDIYGPQEDQKYWLECEQLIDQLPVNVHVNYMGPVVNDRVRAVISPYDLFFLPTRGENFGHVLLEAWSAGLPVLTSDQTPWRALAEKKVGWDLPLNDPTGFVKVIELVATWPVEQRSLIRTRCEAFAVRHIRDDIALEANRNMFRRALEYV